MMKNLVILFASKNSSYMFCPDFDGKSAFDLSICWANELIKNDFAKDFVVFTDIEDLQNKFESIKIVYNSQWNVSTLFQNINQILTKNDAQSAIYAFADCPFLNQEITKKLLDSHYEYQAEYTFADGYPYGFAPEIIDVGTCGILAELSKTNFAKEGQWNVKKDSIFSFLKLDINSFEIETVLAQTDWRLFRFNFDCSKKEYFVSCKELWKNAQTEKDIEVLSKIASENPAILKTVPSYYNIQICDSCTAKCIYCPYPKCYEEKNKINPSQAKNQMSFENFCNLVDKIKDFSNQAVINLSLWGEPFNHPQLLDFIKKVLSYDSLSVFIETDGQKITQSFCDELKQIVENAAERTNGWQKVMIAISLDATTNQTYQKIRNVQNDIQEVLEKIKMISQVLPDSVYPQFVRTNYNEEELESFYRFWNGNVIIQKYDDFAHLLPECKPADLSPLERNVCWHLRRDMVILTNGDVPFCKEYVLDGIIGNVFEQNLEEIWKKTDDVVKEHICQKYNSKCGNCDEYYTFNF